jgi:hypothetical protein
MWLVATGLAIRRRAAPDGSRGFEATVRENEPKRRGATGEWLEICIRLIRRYATDD